MKDLLGRDVQVGHYICYALTVGRSANLAVYQVKEVLEDKITAIKLESSYGQPNWDVNLQDGKTAPRKYCKFVYNPGGESHFKEMSEKEKAKVDNKTSTLSMPERIFILDRFTPELLKGSDNELHQS